MFFLGFFFYYFEIFIPTLTDLSLATDLKNDFGLGTTETNSPIPNSLASMSDKGWMGAENAPVENALFPDNIYKKEPCERPPWVRNDSDEKT